MINGTSVDVTVAIADKNNAGGDDKRTGIDQVGISYVDGNNKTIYKTLDVVDDKGNPLPQGVFAPEDIDYSSEFGVYVVAVEGGKDVAAIIYTAELETNSVTKELQMVIKSETTMDVYTTDNGIEGLAIDVQGNVYMGEQDSGRVYRVDPQLDNDGNIIGFDKSSKTLVLETGSNDLAGLDFDANGDLVVSFGNRVVDYHWNGEEQVKNAIEPNSVVKFSANDNDPSAPFSANGEVLFVGSEETGTGKDEFDAEAVMIDSDGEVVIGSDNGFDTDYCKRYCNSDSQVLVAPTEQVTIV